MNNHPSLLGVLKTNVSPLVDVADLEVDSNLQAAVVVVVEEDMDMANMQRVVLLAREAASHLSSLGDSC